MQIALLSDMHSNVQALDACLRHASERGAEHYAFLGDFVGYGADPQGVVDVVAGYAARGAVVLKGNHDEALEKRGSYFNEAAQAALDLARANNVDLIVLGAPGPSQRALAWWRSVASSVTANAPCSVHVVRVPERRPAAAGDQE